MIAEASRTIRARCGPRRAPHDGAAPGSHRSSGRLRPANRRQPRSDRPGWAGRPATPPVLHRDLPRVPAATDVGWHLDLTASSDLSGLHERSLLLMSHPRNHYSAARALLAGGADDGYSSHMRRTQVYITEEQDRRLADIASQRGISKAGALRWALDWALETGDVEAAARAIIRATAGSCSDYPDWPEWQRSVRGRSADERLRSVS